ncbi:MAG: hypothetical protein KTQ49_02255 [Candidatus Omnitrophica bacterium]|nr:hypothetical protein [Candidatus Omnitrophota bacterium]
MMMEKDDPKDWEELEEETAPEQLRRKWVVEEHFKKTAVCPSCGKATAADNLTCLFCGATLNEATGFLGKLLKGFKGMFR